MTSLAFFILPTCECVSVDENTVHCQCILAAVILI